MATCPKCNTQQPDGLNYCIKCGNLLGQLPPKKNIPAKGLILGGCGCAILLSIIIGIVIVLAFAMVSMNRQPPRQPTPPQPQPAPQAPTTTQPQVEKFPTANEEEIVIMFAKGLTEDGNVIDATIKFSPDDPQIVQILTWGPNTIAKGSCLLWVWLYEEKTYVYKYNYTVEKEGQGAVVDRIKRPDKGFVKGEYTVVVFIDETAVLTHSFTVN